MKRVDGNIIASQIKAELKGEISLLQFQPVLAIYLLVRDPINTKFLKIKHRFAEEIGVKIEETEFRVDLPEDELIESLVHDASDPVIGGLVVQLPLPERFDTVSILSHIPIEKDVDCVSDKALNTFHKSGDMFPPVAGAVDRIFSEYGIELTGKKIVILGEGRLVGVPTALLFERREIPYKSFNAKSSEGEKWEAVASADIIISGMRQPGLITPDKIKEGVVLIDAGTSEAVNGKTQGDASLSCEEKCLLFSPSVGGVGPITVALLFRNLLTALKKRT